MTRIRSRYRSADITESRLTGERGKQRPEESVVTVAFAWSVSRNDGGELRRSAPFRAAPVEKLSRIWQHCDALGVSLTLDGAKDEGATRRPTDRPSERKTRGRFVRGGGGRGPLTNW